MTASNPLATRVLHVYATRGDGQVQAPAIKTLGLKIGKIFKFGERQFEVDANIFNVLNAGGFNQYSYNSAYQTWSSTSCRCATGRRRARCSSTSSGASSPSHSGRGADADRGAPRPTPLATPPPVRTRSARERSPTFTQPNGTTQTNPLSTRNR